MRFGLNNTNTKPIEYAVSRDVDLRLFGLADYRPECQQEKKVVARQHGTFIGKCVKCNITLMDKDLNNRLEVVCPSCGWKYKYSKTIN